MNIPQDIEKSPIKDYPLVDVPINDEPKNTLLNYTILENLANILMIITSITYFTNSLHSIFNFKIQVDSIYAKNIISILQEGLKFITYLSNDLNVYVNQTISDSNLQQIDSCYDNNQYKFNIWGFCRYDQFGTRVCYHTQTGINMIGDLIQDIGMQLGNLTNQPNPIDVSLQFVDVYYKSTQQLCESPPSKLINYQQHICQLQLYNTCGEFVSYLGMFHFYCLLILMILVIIEMPYTLIKQIYKCEIKLSFVYYCKIGCLACCFISFYMIFLITLAMHIPINTLLKLYPIGSLQFEGWGFIIWNMVFIVNIAIIIYVGRKKKNPLIIEQRLKRQATNDQIYNQLIESVNILTEQVKMVNEEVEAEDRNGEATFKRENEKTEQLKAAQSQLSAEQQQMEAEISGLGARLQ
ncbi:hypothetical protein JA1_004113 [Spathaspora sp. JA1]|nr:hypothetical protein JA1_004113 [Spathaspora sp. JA1]